MNDVRLWIVLLSVMCFLAGAVSGLLIAEQASETELADDPLTDYQRLMAERFDLSADLTRNLSGWMRLYEKDIEAIRERYTADVLSAMEPELRARGNQLRATIRDRVLPPARRAEFDRLAYESFVNL